MARRLEPAFVFALRRRPGQAGVARTTNGLRRIPSNGLSSNDPRGGEGRPNTGSRPCPEDVPLAALVDVIKLRWRIERDHEELKSELGLAHFEGRSWRGFHHIASLCIAAQWILAP